MRYEINNIKNELKFNKRNINGRIQIVLARKDVGTRAIL